MRVQDIMTKDPTCCRPDNSIAEAAKLMSKMDCGALPVVDEAGVLVGVVTDRDICCRGVAEGKSGNIWVAELMSSDVLTVALADDISACCDRMEERQVRRAIVIDDAGKCCGIVAQADIARKGTSGDTFELVRDVSEPR